MLGVFWQIKNRLKYPGTRGLIGRAKLKTLKETTLNSFFMVAKMQGLQPNNHFSYNQQTGIIKFFNDSEILLKDLFYYPSDPNFDELGSLEITDAFIDEANQVVSKAKQIVRSRIRYKLQENDLVPKMLMTCNPAKNWTYLEFYKPSRLNELPINKRFIQSLVTDNPNIEPSYIDNLKQLDNTSKQRLLFGNWEYDDDPSRLIDFEKISDLWNNNFVKHGQKYITADIALHGSDKFVIVVWSGWRVIDILVYKKSDGKEVIDYIKSAAYKYSVPNSNICYDSDGLGGYIGGFISNAKAFKNGSSPIKSKDGVEYANLKSQCYFEYSKKVQANQVYIIPVTNQSEIIKEHEQIKNYSIDTDNKLRVLPKDKVKEIIGRSPDFTDALMMRIYFDLKPNYSNFMSRA